MKSLIMPLQDAKQTAVISTRYISRQFIISNKSSQDLHWTSEVTICLQRPQKSAEIDSQPSQSESLWHV